MAFNPSAIRRRRTDRFIDPEGSFQKIPVPKDGFASTSNYNNVRELFSANFSEILQILQKELSADKIFYVTWTNAKGKFQALKSILSNKNRGMPQLPDECHIAVIAYTMELDIGDSSLYLDFNQKCRALTNANPNAWKNFPYKSFYALLARAIHGIRNNPDVNSHTYYRGIRHKISNLKTGDYIFSPQFLSCTVDENEARRFTDSAGGGGTLITLKGTPLAACGIVEYSDFKYEQEMLLFPWNTFKVTKIEHSNHHEDNIFLEIVGPLVKGVPYSGKYMNNGITVHNG